MTHDAGRPKAVDEEIEYLDSKAPSGAKAATDGPPEVGGKAAAPRPRPRIDPAVLKAFRARIRRKDDQIGALKQELAGLKDQYVRKLADMENIRKRMEREKTDYYQFALNEILLELLMVIDNFERALASPEAEANGKTFRNGIDLILRQLWGALQKRGVTVVESEGAPFDPAVHNAMLTEETDAITEPQVGEVLQKGYLLGGRLLRPALVKVLMPRKKD